MTNWFTDDQLTNMNLRLRFKFWLVDETVYENQKANLLTSIVKFCEVKRILLQFVFETLLSLQNCCFYKVNQIGAREISIHISIGQFETKAKSKG